MRWAGHVTHMGRRGMDIEFWWETKKERKPMGRPTCKWVDNIKMDLREIE
jgi:hypothetical protein